MKFLKFVSATTALAGLVTLAAAQEQMPSFEQVRKRYDQTSDLTRVSYLYRRCAALQLNVAAILLRNKKVAESQNYENLATHYMLLSEEVDRETDKRRNVKSGKAMESVELSVKYISEQYDSRMRANHAKRGEYFAGDVVLEAELAECLKPESFAKRLHR